MAEAAENAPRAERLRITVLGCGASPGVPRIGNDWGACDPSEPKNRRTRSSILIDGFRNDSPYPTRVLVDTGPDMRNQLLDARVDRLDAVLFTHPHADHTHGIDDLRSFWLDSRRLVPVYTDDFTQERLEEAFGYCFHTPAGGSYPPILGRVRIEPGTAFSVDGPGGRLDILPFRQIHGEIDSLGFRIGDFAYSSDVSALPSETVPKLDGLSLWIVDALRWRPHPSHFSVDETLGWHERLRPRRTVLTHMHGDLDYRVLAAKVPGDVEPAFDGMVLDVSL
ncbi:MBL fold metallo-hydrolase [Kaistia dalseonensis]|uniref:Phosphoribosyl 1,2-cyclic phosphate phosphodiesterase n=1 Tax=Kaistia dalseonensis TaxID=410840 RepID=A0ABU0H2M9_9HYPH|nr:MBL fold metallo-hydrolase [Kaistia dalseonensis]MCX5493992.1 MBL fold metallo-hydrolase [Kaistia dalseonensis]MDQ0436568.1 phosphoribosyl 1,2-cyclic phosphate phosphodiesterase [Kaistia dalseonensis]